MLYEDYPLQRLLQGYHIGNLLDTLYHITEGYTIDFAKLIHDYMINVSEISQNSQLSYSNLLTQIFQAYNIPLMVGNVLPSLFLPSAPLKALIQTPFHLSLEA